MHPWSFATWEEYVPPLIAFNMETSFFCPYSQQDGETMSIQH